MSVASWDSYFLEMARLVASKSKDRSTKCGCVVVGPDNEVRSTGFNGFPRGVDDCVDARHERPAKYLWTEHAERNAIYNAARMGIALKGCRIYVTLCPCVDCARAIVQSGIVEVIVDRWKADARWDDSMMVGGEIFEEARVKVRAPAVEHDWAQL